MGQNWCSEKPSQIEDISDKLNVIDDFYATPIEDLTKEQCEEACFTSFQIRNAIKLKRHGMSNVLNRIPIQFKTKTICDLYLLMIPTHYCVLFSLHPNYHNIINFSKIHLEYDHKCVDHEKTSNSMKLDLKKFSDDKNVDIINVELLRKIIDKHKTNCIKLLHASKNSLGIIKKYKSMILDTLSVISEDLLTVEMKALIEQLNE